MKAINIVSEGRGHDDLVDIKISGLTDVADDAVDKIFRCSDRLEGRR